MLMVFIMTFALKYLIQKIVQRVTDTETEELLGRNDGMRNYHLRDRHYVKPVKLG